VSEIGTFEQQGFAPCSREGIGETIPEIYSRSVPAAPAEIPIGFARDPRLRLGNGLDDQLRLADEIVKTAADDRITASVKNYGSFEEISRRDERSDAASIALAQAVAAGSSRRIAISAEVSMIIAASRAHRKADRRDRQIGVVP
jgi:hypothetical protein